MTNHTGGTEVRGSVEATTSTEGYTGDTYCKGCDTKLADGKTIPKKTAAPVAVAAPAAAAPVAHPAALAVAALVVILPPPPL